MPDTPSPDPYAGSPYPATPPTLRDPWDRTRAIPLGGLLERHEFPPLFTAVLGLILAFLLLQVIIAPIAIFVLLLAEGVPPDELLNAATNLLQDHIRTAFLANTVGQVLGIGLLAFVLARLHTRRPAAFLRLRAPDVRMLALAVVGLLALVPTVQWLASLNQMLPLPDWDWLNQLETYRAELIEQVLRSDLSLLFNLFTLAVTPAICEELLFRGYVQRQAERSLGVLWGIVFSGVVFGFYHLSLLQALPLSVLGIYLAYLAWRTGSLWIPIAAHFTNNALAVAMGAYAAARPDVDLSDIETMHIPWYWVVLGLAVFALVIVALRRLAEQQLAGADQQVP